MNGADAMALVAQMASRPEAVTDWPAAREKLTLIDVRSDDWERYEQSQADGAMQNAASLPIVTQGAAPTSAAAEAVMFGLAANKGAQMGIKDLLAEQDPEFINLPDLLEQMMSEGDSSEEDAAMLLDTLIERASRKGCAVPRWYQLHPHGWEAATDDTAGRFLSDIAAFGYPLRDLALELEDGVLIRTAPDDSDFGFLRSDIYDFLDGQGLKLNREAHVPVATKPDVPRADEAGITQKGAQPSSEIELSEGNAATPEAQSKESISNKERASLQKQIALLALVLSEKSGKYKRGDKPNASQIANAVEDMLDALTDVNRTGLSKTNIRNCIAAGLELLRA
ncbi:hypothetical protein [Paraburkholderia pallida]|uniref:Uncharacterized protein n=1 Tax=Paraburkholderia pallida TaxID=2547399 RepID=A0A4V1AZ35_9BURK|nr:hypothetical protein [Paraburkholderia pallida]QBQ97892.1 hypothetical protein E1956_12375 [Paraburkholderia pallida]